MKTLTLLALAAATVPAVAQRPMPPLTFPWRLVNRIANPGFESTRLSPWVQNCFVVPAGVSAPFTPVSPFGFRKSGGHSGAVCYAFNVDSYAAYPYERMGILHQDLATPLPGSAVWTATVWMYSVGQNLLVQINYTDGTSSSAMQGVASITPNPSDTGWRQWDFRSAIDPSKTIQSIDFRVYANYAVPFDLMIDDVSLSTLEYVG